MEQVNDFFQTLKGNTKVQPEPSRCMNKFCSNSGHIPATGMTGLAANCSSVQSMIQERDAVGGVPTGRGTTPCPFGFYQLAIPVKPP